MALTSWDVSMLMRLRVIRAMDEVMEVRRQRDVAGTHQRTF